MSSTKVRKDPAQVFRNLSMILFVVSLLIGSSFMTVGFTTYSSADTTIFEAEGFAEEIGSVVGQVTKIEGGYTSVSYAIDGEETEIQVSAVADSFPVGSPITVLYNVNKPEEIRTPDIVVAMCRTNGSKMMKAGGIIAFAILFVGVLFYGIGMYIRKKRKEI